MGMFDYVRCEHPLPAPDTAGLEFQTKDLGCELDVFTIRADGSLWRTAADNSRNPLGSLSDYFGEVRFYAFLNHPGRTGSWLEFRARFVDSRLYGPIVLVADGRPASSPSPHQDTAPAEGRGAIADGVQVPVEGQR